jgi:cytochrome c oxidase cbb3-type subunit 3
MPAIDLREDDVTAVAVYIHSVLATSRAQGAPPPGEAVTLNILVGDASAGAVYFDAKCGSCHSPTGDLQGIATRVPDPMQLQNLWVRGGRELLLAADDVPGKRTMTAIVTTPAGARVEGRLDRVDDFTITLILADGTRRTFRRTGDVPKVEINDPLAIHKQLLQVYTDREMHNITAYLMSLK